MQMETSLVDLKSILTLIEEGANQAQVKQELKQRDIKDQKELEQMIDDLEIKLKLKNKKEKTEEEKYDLLDVDD